MTEHESALQVELYHRLFRLQKEPNIVRVAAAVTEDQSTLQVELYKRFHQVLKKPSSVCGAAAMTEDERALQLELYYRFLRAQGQGYDGAFDEFVRMEVELPVLESIPPEDEEEEEVCLYHVHDASAEKEGLLCMVGRKCSINSKTPTHCR